ncbi:hypothetical protein E2C01_082766 [Portunus trituberculatus]|uniref:Uncharacterized protein n=1 Tax=Portunus trituberculatus TaxID=210409 RepID=A0A5B7J1P0_PORTR|nr:hypothetical protein [Portunus trituberculatus]
MLFNLIDFFFYQVTARGRVARRILAAPQNSASVPHPQVSPSHYIAIVIPLSSTECVIYYSTATDAHHLPTPREARAASCWRVDEQER